MSHNLDRIEVETVHVLSAVPVVTSLQLLYLS